MLSSRFDSKINSIWIRGASLFVLVILLQVLMARASLVKETKRRLQHAMTGHALVQISYVLPRNVAIVLLMLGAVGIYALQTYFPDHFRKTFGPLLRPKELNGRQLPGAFYFLLGTAATVFFVEDWTVARYAVECLAIADPVASWIGSSVSSPKLNDGSSISGCAACFLTSLFVGWMMLPSTTSISTVSIGALVCTIAEALPFGNDNMNVPILTGLAVDYLEKRVENVQR